MVLEYLKISAQLGIIAFLFVFALVYKKEVKQLFTSLSSLKVKKGDTEISLSQHEVTHTDNYRNQKSELESQKKEPEKDIDTNEKADQCDYPTCVKMSKAISEDRLEDAKKHFEELQKSEQDETMRLKHEACYNFQLSSIKNDSKAFNRLKELTNNKTAADFAHHFLGMRYIEMCQYDLALKEYQHALDSAQKPKDKANAIQEIASCYYHTGKKSEAIDYLRKELIEQKDAESRTILLSRLVKLYDNEKDYHSKALAAEQLLELKPDSTYYRFEAAYAYSNADIQTLCLIHYNAYCQLDAKNPGGHNNLGVVYDRLGLQFLAVEEFNKSADLQNTLAMANIANKYINAGFKEEATALLKKANQCKEVHQNVGNAWSDLLKKDEKEGEKLKMLLQTGREQQIFMREYAKAYEDPASHLIQSDSVYCLPGNKEYKVNIVKENDIHFFVETDNQESQQIRGKIHNRTVLMDEVHIFKKKGSEEERLFKTGEKLFGIISKDGTLINVLRYSEEKCIKEEWTKKEDRPA